MRKACHYFSISLLIGLIVIGFGACRDSERDLDDETESSRDFATMQNLLNDAFKQVHRVALYDSVLNDTGIVQLIDTNCLDTFYTTTGLNQFPTTLVLNYGTGYGPACLDGRYRKGEIRARFTSKYTNPNAIITFTFDNYWVDLYKLDGTMVMTGLGNGNYTVSVTDGSVFWTPSVLEFTVTYDGSYTLEREDGTATLDPEDDIFRISSGVGSGVNSRGNTYTANVTDPLRVALSCSWMIDGGVRLKPSNLQTRDLDFGSGACDSRLMITINNREFEATIPGYND